MSMSLADELQKLEDLRRSGALSNVEFAQAKAALLAGTTAAPENQPLAKQLAEVRLQNELAQIEREWDIERQKYLIQNRYGARIVPTSGMGIGMAVIGGIFGLFWTVMAVAITGSAPDIGPFWIAKIIFPLFGVLFICGAVGFGIYAHTRAQAYQRAFEEYQARLRALRPQ
jgi:hypothetical protein